MKWRQFRNINGLKSSFLTFLALLVSGLTMGQLHPILESFDIRQVGNEVEFRFGVAGGASCSGVDLERSTDTTAFEIVGVIPGVCGGSPETEFYDIRDEEPLVSETMYYRLRLGAQGWSDYVAFDFVPVDNEGLNIYPNPANVQTTVRLNNPGGKIWSVTVYSANGSLWREFQNLSGAEVALDLSEWTNGMYFLRITEGGQNWTRRLTVY